MNVLTCARPGQTLDASERPLGLCGVASQTDRYSGGVLLMVGRASTTNDSAFMSASLTADYQVTVCYKPLITGRCHCHVHVNFL